LPEVGEGPSPRLQGRSSPWQGLRDLQVEPAFQGAPALIARSAARHPGATDPEPQREGPQRCGLFACLAWIPDAATGDHRATDAIAAACAPNPAIDTTPR